MISRRTFIRTIAPLLTSPGVTVAAARKLNLGIGTYTYHSLSIDDMIIQLRRLQILEIEMSRGEFMLFSRPSPADVRIGER